MYSIVLAFITAFTLSYVSMPSIIHIAQVKKLYDLPDARRSHKEITPSLGGVGIFAGIIFSIVLWTPFSLFGDLQYIICGLLLIFLIGVKDDILPISPKKKLLGQIVVASIIAYKADVYLSSMYGLFGIYELPYWIGIALSIFTIVTIINAFNLIDGINGLASGVTCLIATTLGLWFFLVDRIELAIIAFALVGATMAFLKYNITPARIFMGDTGSLLIGLVCAILVIEFIEFNQELIPSNIYRIKSAPAVGIGILVLPLFDTLRVFTTRVIKGKSPFVPDRTHIHHLLLDADCTHMQATSILILVNVLFIGLVYRFQHIGTLNLLSVILILASILSLGLYFYVRNKKRKFVSNTLS